MFLELPKVDNTISKSPFCTIPSKGLEKILSKPRSFPQAVKVELSRASGITG